jgi:hypothetical protein
MGAPAAGVGNVPGKAARRATVLVGVTCGAETVPVPGLMPCTAGELVKEAPLSACPPIVVGS